MTQLVNNKKKKRSNTLNKILIECFQKNKLKSKRRLFDEISPKRNSMRIKVINYGKTGLKNIKHEMK